MINGNRVLAGVVLHDSSEKGLREEKPGDPEHNRLSIVVPILRSTPPAVTHSFRYDNSHY